MSEPRRLGERFTLLHLAGKGASSEVYRARDVFALTLTPREISRQREVTRERAEAKRDGALAAQPRAEVEAEYALRARDDREDDLVVKLVAHGLEGLYDAFAPMGKPLPIGPGERLDRAVEDSERDDGATVVLEELRNRSRRGHRG
jgi:hypothetical protein